MAITAAQVKELRDRTNIGMMECKKALEETGGDLDEAIKILRERGQVKAAKRADREASEGLIAVSITDDNSAGGLAQLSCETDFVARNEEFQQLSKDLAATALAEKASSTDDLASKTLPNGSGAGQSVEDIRTKIGEKIEIGAAAYLDGDVVVGYVHPPGKIGVLLAASAAGLDSKQAVIDELRGIAMHIAATSPRFLDSSEVNEEILDQEREIFAQIAKNEGKPENIIPKIVDGKIKSFYKDNCLVDQGYVRDPKKSIADVLKELSKSVGAEVKLTGFVRSAIGGS